MDQGTGLLADAEMKARVSCRIAATLLVVMCVSGQSYTAGDLDAAFGTDTLVISASQLGCHRFEVWVAVAGRQHSRGLMHVRDLQPNAGMIFIYTEPARRSMWMKNTYIPLDILFIRADGSVSSMIENTEPLSLRSISSIEPVTFVLELNAGTAERLKIAPGDQMVWSNP